ncbi:MAG: TolC family protein [Treponema sp.]|jgi:outer membrane protein TolC|nr:TolC family protein [Treponema sp.]
MRKNGWPDAGPRPRARTAAWLIIAVPLLAGAAQTGTAQAAAVQTGPPQTAAPETNMRLTMDAAVELALRNNLSLRNGAITLDTKKRASDLVWNQFLPDLALRGTLARQNKAATQTVMMPSAILLGNYMPIPGTSPAQVFGVSPGSVEVPRWSMLGNISASLNLSLALFAGIEAIKADYEAGLVTYERARLQVERDVRKAYNDMLLLAENIALLRESYEAVEQQVSTAQANYRAGLAPELTLLQAQVSRDNMKPGINQAENGLILSQARFAMTLGLPYETRFDLVSTPAEAGSIPLDLTELIREATRNKPDIRELLRQLTALEKNRHARSLQTHTPYLRFDLSLNPTFGADPFKDNWFKKDNWSDRGSFSITLGINLNGLFPFTKEGQAIKDMDNQIKSLAGSITQMIQGTELEIYNTLLTLAQVQSTMDAQAETVRLAEQSYRLTEEAYRAGLQDFLQVQNAELELHKARLEIIRQQNSYRNSLIDLEYAAGLPFGTLSVWEGGN